MQGNDPYKSFKTKSCMQHERSGVPQELALEPVHLNIFVGDMDSGIECTVGKFADTELFDAVDMLEGRDAIQRNLDRLEALCEPREGQQGQLQSSAPGLGESPAQTQTGQRMD
ncbi:rna-directed dna polymerase from mobile element jockey-like [Willisornis vidua]|uniref:Rna-directed dna polymerase from mobile element jockey-like n=1 Tax=Willisornis vidua TaxID=1566151 RepID=A0ABQ9DE68_9PASS|nr:rna-directed dna polymerase from mobile element jockey-like [Willisornis vidua]